MTDLNNATHVFLAGIGGIGVSALARHLLKRGKVVTGTDLTVSPITEALTKEGATIIYGQNIEQLPPDVEVIVYSNAIPQFSPLYFDQLVATRKPVFGYTEALAQISKDLFTIAVSGTHGKTTTTAMLAKIMCDAGLSPTVVVGSNLIEGDTNYIHGDSKYFLVEADEYKRAFLALTPSLVVITNIGLDHLDYYSDIDDIVGAFSEFVNKVPKDHVVANTKGENIGKLFNKNTSEILDWSKVELDNLVMRFPGEHNRENARAAICAASHLGIDIEKSIKSLGDFKGTWRRFEYKGETARGAIIYDDYAHNPDKVRSALLGAREVYSDKKILAVFQPHLYSRTKQLFSAFVRSLMNADEVILAPIFSAREEYDESINSDILASALRDAGTKAISLPDFGAIRDVLETRGEDTVIITMGAGDIYTVASMLISRK